MQLMSRGPGRRMRRLNFDSARYPRKAPGARRQGGTKIGLLLESGLPFFATNFSTARFYIALPRPGPRSRAGVDTTTPGDRASHVATVKRHLPPCYCRLRYPDSAQRPPQPWPPSPQALELDRATKWWPTKWWLRFRCRFMAPPATSGLASAVASQIAACSATVCRICGSSIDPKFTSREKPIIRGILHIGNRRPA